MKKLLYLLKHTILLPIILFQFSCEETVVTGCEGACNGDVIGSWMLTALAGEYTYVVDLPDDSWPADTSFGIQLRWDMADYVFVGDAAGYSDYANLWAAEVSAGDTIPGVSTSVEYSLAHLQGGGIGLIGVFEDAPSAGSYASYHFRGVYPGIFYNYSECSSSGDVADMGDQGIYKIDQTSSSENFEIKRDPSIGGDQVLPPFSDGTLTFTDATLNEINIQFKDRDSHSSLYTEIPDYVWDEGTHPTENDNVNSGGDRTYMAFPPVLAVADIPGVGSTFIGSYDPDSETHNSPSTGPAYVFNEALLPWGNYMTYNAFCFQLEMGALAEMGALTDSNADGSMADDLVGHMLTSLLDDPASATHGIGMPYASLVSMGDDGTTPTITNDSDHDLDMNDTAAGGRMKYNINHNDCAVPANVTIDFDATLSRCTSDNCIDDGYHVNPDWD